MKNNEIKLNYLDKIKETLESDNFDWIDYILEYLYGSWIWEDVLEKLDDILQELTLYLEFKEEEYKQNTLKMIKEFK